MVYFTNTSAKITPEDTTKRISSITVRLFFYNCTGAVYVTDLLLEGGSVATGWVGHPSEIQWSLDG
jgi:hypothetical protein